MRHAQRQRDTPRHAFVQGERTIVGHARRGHLRYLQKTEDKRRTELAATRARRGVHRPAVQELEWTRTRVS
jgi:hypothetical protein